jgi:hypothetical protein
MADYKVLMVADSGTPVRPFVELSKQLENQINAKVYILCTAEAMDYKRILKGSGLEYEDIAFIEFDDVNKYHVETSSESVNVSSKENENVIKRSPLYKLWRRIYKSSQLVKLAVDIKDIIKLLIKQQKKIDKIEQIFKTYSPDLVILYSDIKIFGSSVIKVASKYNIKSIVAPIAIAYDPQRMIRNGIWCYRKDINEKYTILDKYVIDKYPKSHYKVGDIIALRYSPVEIVVYDILKILPGNPWVVGSGKSTYFATSSQQMADELINSMDETYGKKTYITCTIEETYIKKCVQNSINSIRDNIIKKYGITSSKIVCIALSAYAKASTPYIDFEKEKNNYILIINELVKNFDIVLVSLHPIMQRENYMYLYDINGCKIVDEPLYKIIPACDVFVGGSESSTREMVKRLNIHKIFYNHEAFIDGISQNDVENIRNEAQHILMSAPIDVSYDDAGTLDFVDLVVDILEGSV